MYEYEAENSSGFKVATGYVCSSCSVEGSAGSLSFEVQKLQLQANYGYAALF